MRKKAAFKTLRTYELRCGPVGKRIDEYIREGSCEIDVPDEVGDLIDEEWESGVHYEGVGHVLIRDGRTGGVYPQEIRFRIDAASIQEAFAKYDEAAKAAADEYAEQMEEAKRRESSRILVADQMPPKLRRSDLDA